MSNTFQKVTRARTSLVLDQPFFGVLSLKLRLKSDPTCKTAWVDGVTLGFNPTWIETLTSKALVGLVAHEVMHCAAGHPWRRGMRDPKRWNEAADYAINAILLAAGFKLPEGGLFNPDYAGKSAEWIYDRLEAESEKQEQPQQGEPGDGEQGDEQDDGDEQGDGDEGSEQGEVRDAPSGDGAEPSSEADWQATAQQAARAASAQNKLPAALRKFADEIVELKVDWRSVMHRFVQETASSDFTWSRPSTRYLPRGLYLPALYSEQMGPLVIAIDTSGSIDEVMLTQFFNELRAIVAETQPREVTVMYCDDAVRRTETFGKDDEITSNPLGGHGTKFSPVFEAVEQLEEVPAALVYLTDLGLWGEEWPEDPGYPVLWAATSDAVAPMGETVSIR
jgi:predicted metal-dependent peptidase